MQAIVVIALLSIAPLVLVASCLIPAPLTISDPPDGGNTSRPNITGVIPALPGPFTLQTASEEKEIRVTVEDTDGDDITVRFWRDYSTQNPAPIGTVTAMRITGALGRPTYTAKLSFAWCSGVLDPNVMHNVNILVSDRGFKENMDPTFTTPRDPLGLTTPATLLYTCAH